MTTEVQHTRTHTYTPTYCMCALFAFLITRTLSQGGSSVLTPVVVARDRGEPPNTVECTLVVRLYDLDQVVALTLNNPYNEIAGKVEIFETVLSDILGDEIADVYVVELIAINET